MMNWHDFFSAFALALVIEGILPFSSPNRCRLMLTFILQQSDSVLRMMGLICMMLGVGLLYAVR